MRIGVGLPVSGGVTGRALLEWAERAEALGFASLSTTDRVAYPTYEPLTALAGAAAVTSAIGLRTNVLLAPTRSVALLAKQAASVDQISGGRLLLGVGVGRRPDDYEAVGLPFGDRGRRFDAALGALRAAWEGGEAGPPTTRPGGVPLLFGGSVDVAVPRAVRHGTGWTVALRPADEVAAGRERLGQEWRDAGRDGEPYVVAMHYFALGGTSSVDHLLRYYGYQGDRARAIAEGAARTEEQAAGAVAAFEAAGVDEYVFAPAVPDPDQLDRLADAVGR